MAGCAWGFAADGLPAGDGLGFTVVFAEKSCGLICGDFTSNFIAPCVLFPPFRLNGGYILVSCRYVLVSVRYSGSLQAERTLNVTVAFWPSRPLSKVIGKSFVISI